MLVKEKDTSVTSQASATVLSVMLAVPDTPAAVEWYKKALGARVL